MTALDDSTHKHQRCRGHLDAIVETTELYNRGPHLHRGSRCVRASVEVSKYYYYSTDAGACAAGVCAIDLHSGADALRCTRVTMRCTIAEREKLYAPRAEISGGFASCFT